MAADEVEGQFDIFPLNLNMGIDNVHLSKATGSQEGAWLFEKPIAWTLPRKSVSLYKVL